MGNSTHFQPDTQDRYRADYESESSDPTSKKEFLAQCAANADDLLVSIGMEPCAQCWVQPSFKEDRERIMRKLVELRDTSEEYAKITGDIAFFLNAPFLLGKSNQLKDNQSNNWANAIFTSFNTFYMEASHSWRTYNPDKATYTTYMDHLSHKVRYQSKENPEEYDTNRIYIYKKLEKFEQEITSAAAVSGNELKTRLHIKSRYSMTIIDGYMQWKIQKTPVSIDADNSPVANLPISAEQKSGKSHLRSPEESAIENDKVESFISRVEEMIAGNMFPDHGKSGSVRELVRQIAYGNDPSASKIARELGISKEWPRIKQKLRSDPILCRIMEPKVPCKIKSTTHKTPKLNRPDEYTASDEEEVSSTYVTSSFSQSHPLDH